MKTKSLIQLGTFLLIVIQALPSISQSYWSKRYDIDRGNDYGEQLIEYNDRLLVLTKAFCEINTRECGGILCLEQDGSIAWKLVYYDTIETNYFESMVIQKDTLLVHMNYINVDDEAYSIVFFDLEGQEVRRIDYNYPGLPEYYWARNIATDGESAFVTFATRSDLQTRPREIIRAYDSSWNVRWETSVPNTFLNPTWCDIEATPDGGVVALYSSWRDGVSRMATIEKYSADGMMEWQTPLPHIGHFLSGWVKLDTHPDGGYIGIWHFDSLQAFITQIPTIVFKLNAGGDIEWEKMNLTEQVRLNDVFSARNGDIIGCGIAEEWKWGEVEPDYRVGYVVRYNADGETIWDRKIADETEGADSYDLFGGIELLNGDLAFTGGIDDTIFGTPEDATPGNVWVIKLDSMGCLTPGCGEWQHITTSIREIERDSPEFNIYPNPASDYILIGACLGAHIRKGTYTGILFDMRGQMVARKNFDPHFITELDVGAFPSGNYVITIWTDGLLVQSEKLHIR